MIDGSQIQEIWQEIIHWTLIIFGFPVKIWLWFPDWVKGIVYFLLCAFALMIFFLVWKNKDRWQYVKRI